MLMSTEPYTFPAEAWIILLVVLVLLVAALSLAVYLRYKTITGMLCVCLSRFTVFVLSSAWLKS